MSANCSNANLVPELLWFKPGVQIKSFGSNVLIQKFRFKTFEEKDLKAFFLKWPDYYFN